MNYTNWSSVNTFGDWLQTANTNSGGIFWASMLISFIVIVFISFVYIGFESAAMISLFMGLLAGIFLLYMGLVGTNIVGIIVGLLIIIIIYAVFSSYKSNY